LGLHCSFALHSVKWVGFYPVKDFAKISEEDSNVQTVMDNIQTIVNNVQNFW